MSVRALGLGGEMPELYLKTSKEHVELRFSSAQPGAKMKAAKSDSIALYRKLMDEEGKEKFVVDQKVKIPAGSNGILLLGWLVDGKPRCLAIKDEHGAARFNDWLLINTTKLPIAFSAGEKTKPIVLAGGESREWKIKAEKNKGVGVAAKAKIDGKTKLILSSYLPVREGKRLVLLIVNDGKKVKVKRISDQLSSSANGNE